MPDPSGVVWPDERGDRLGDATERWALPLKGRYVVDDEGEGDSERGGETDGAPWKKQYFWIKSLYDVLGRLTSF